MFFTALYFPVLQGTILHIFHHTVFQCIAPRVPTLPWLSQTPLSPGGSVSTCEAPPPRPHGINSAARWEGAEFGVFLYAGRTQDGDIPDTCKWHKWEVSDSGCGCHSASGSVSVSVSAQCLCTVSLHSQEVSESVSVEVVAIMMDCQAEPRG